MTRWYPQLPHSFCLPCSIPPSSKHPSPAASWHLEGKMCYERHCRCHLSLCRRAVMKLFCPVFPQTCFAMGCCLPPSLCRLSLHPAGLFIISICSCLSLLRDTNSKHLSPVRTCRLQSQPAGDSGSGGEAPCSSGSCTPPTPCQVNPCPPKCQGMGWPSIMTRKVCLVHGGGWEGVFRAVTRPSVSSTQTWGGSGRRGLWAPDP